MYQIVVTKDIDGEFYRVRLHKQSRHDFEFSRELYSSKDKADCIAHAKAEAEKLGVKWYIYIFD